MMTEKKIAHRFKRPFHSKYRPICFRNIIGQEHIISYFKSASMSKRISFAYLLVGKHGVGKTTVSRIMAKTLNCPSALYNQTQEPCNKCSSCLNITLGKSFDVHEINAAMNTGIDNIRDVIEKIQLSPVNSFYKVCIIDEVHMLSINAFNALLKVLEEPPKNVLFILATTDIKRIPKTVVSRCHKLCFLPLNNKDLAIAISKVVWIEQGKITNQALFNILNSSEGSFRDALAMIDMLMIQDKNINQTSFSFLLIEIPCSVFTLLFKYLLSHDIRKIIQVFYYLEDKDWLVYGLINRMQKTLQEEIFNNSQLSIKNFYLISLLQLFSKYHSLDFSTSNVSLFISDLIILSLGQKKNLQLYSVNDKKTIPVTLHMEIVNVY